VTASQGHALIEALKTYVLGKMREEPECAAWANGLGNTDIEAMCDLALNLDSQDHYLSYSILQCLVRDGSVEQIRWPSSPRRPKYGLRIQS
jgi:hypothetical protein